MAYLIEGSKHTVIYCANYRVASGATADLLLKMDARRIGSHHSVPDKKYSNSIIVETVRHHCDVMCSWWFWRNTSIPFPDFVRLVLDGKHGALKPDAFYGKFYADYVMRYETLEVDWLNLCVNAGLLHYTLPRYSTKRPLERTKETNWQNLMPRELQKEVLDRYQDEFEKFNYGISY